MSEKEECMLLNELDKLKLEKGKLRQDADLCKKILCGFIDHGGIPNWVLELTPKNQVLRSIGQMDMTLIESMRTLEIDHEPDGWPAVKMRDISALCDEIDLLRRAAKMIHYRRTMVSGSLEMAECDLVCKEAGLYVWTWPL